MNIYILYLCLQIYYCYNNDIVMLIRVYKIWRQNSHLKKSLWKDFFNLNILTSRDLKKNKCVFVPKLFYVSFTMFMLNLFIVNSATNNNHALFVPLFILMGILIQSSSRRAPATRWLSII